MLDKIDTKLDQLRGRQDQRRGVALLAELRTTNQRLGAVLDDPALKRLPADADAALVQLKKTLDDPNLAKSIAHLQSTLTRLDRHHRRRRSRPDNDVRQPAPDHRQPARPDRGRQALSVAPAARRAAAAGERPPAMKPSSLPVAPARRSRPRWRSPSPRAARSPRPSPVKSDVPARAAAAVEQERDAADRRRSRSKRSPWPRRFAAGRSSIAKAISSTRPTSTTSSWSRRRR